MPYVTRWGEERPTRKEIQAGAALAYELAGIDRSRLTDTYEPGDLIETPDGPGHVLSCTGLFVTVALDGGARQNSYPKTKVRRA